MSECVFPDNTVLCNFGIVTRLDVLRDALRGRGRWTEAVAFESHRSSSAVPALKGLAEEGWLGEPIEVNKPADIEQVGRIRRAVFGGTEDEPLKHLGEAQTCFLIQNRADLQGAWWVSDDRDALDYARQQGITTLETLDIVAMAVADGDLTTEHGFELMQSMADHGRSLRLPASPMDLLR